MLLVTFLALSARPHRPKAFPRGMDGQTAGGPEGRGWERGRDGQAKAQRQRHTPEGVRPLRPWPPGHEELAAWGGRV